MIIPLPAGWVKIASGIYADEKQTLHVFPSDVLLANGWPDNAPNRLMVERAIAEIYPGAQHVTEEEPPPTRYCDFCGVMISASSYIPYRAWMKVEMQAEDGTPIEDSGEWYACRACSGLIEKKQWEVLLRRGVLSSFLSQMIAPDRERYDRAARKLAADYAKIFTDFKLP